MKNKSQVIKAVLAGIGVLALAQLARGSLTTGNYEPKIFSDSNIFESILHGSTIPTDDAVSSESAINNDDAVTAAEIPHINIDKSRPWQAPNYSNQIQALGWSPTVFSVPPGLKTRVNFWKYVYTQITTDQGILHDSEHLSVVYDKINFPPHSTRWERIRIVRAHKRIVRERLMRLNRLYSVYLKTGVMPKLKGEELRIWNMFTSISGPNKFLQAAQRGRLRFQLGQRNRFILGIYYSGRYLPEMQKVFRKYGLPIELTRLPFVESSFNIKARSRLGASGIWQFMRSTGRRYLRIRYLTDERNDPISATVAAAKMLRANYEMLGNWPLAITGYNHGPAGMLRIVQRYHTSDISDLVDERYGRFGFASANFYACFLAALHVEENAPKYFGPVYWETPLNAKRIELTRVIDRNWLLHWFGGNLARAEKYNPQLRRPFWLGYGEIGRYDFVRVPTSQYQLALQDLKTLPLHVSRKWSKRIATYVIQSGETLSGIASELGVRVSLLEELNNIANPRLLRPGQKLRIPVSSDE